MADLTQIHDWIKNKKVNDPNWVLPENTGDFIAGIESDMTSLSKQLGVDLSLYVIIPKKKNTLTKNILGPN